MTKQRRPLTRSESGRLGGFAAAAVVDTSERGRKAQAGLLARFREDVLVEAMAAGLALSDDEIDRRAEAKRRLHFYRLNLKRWGKLPGKGARAA